MSAPALALVAALALLPGTLLSGAAQADFPWFGAGREAAPVRILIEDNVRGGCWRDAELVVAGVRQVLDRYGIAVADRADTHLLISAVGHPSSSARYGSRLSCVGVMSLRVSSTTRDDDDMPLIEDIYSQERLLVARNVLDHVLTNNAKELAEQFSGRYVGRWD